MKLMRIMSLAGCFTALLVGIVAPSFSHHSPAVFDLTKQVKLVGIAKEFRWSNPHSWIDLSVPNGNGGAEAWSVEMGGPAALVKAGWKSSTIKVGDEVTIVANPLRTSEKSAKFVSITLPNGQTLTERPLPVQ